METNSTTYWKLALATVTLFVALFGSMSNAAAAVCSNNCLRVYSIELTDLGSYIRGIVKLTDETGSGAGARSSVVHAVWTRPDGTTLDQYANIGTRLRAEFRLYNGGAAGSYKLTVAGASKAGYTFDPDASALLEKSITVGSLENQPPTAVPNADVTSGEVPLVVSFESSASTDSDGYIAAYSWDFGDGSTSAEPNPVHTYATTGNWISTLRVTDDQGASSSSSILIMVSENNMGCISNCVSVDAISLTYKTRKSRIKGFVWLVDENGEAATNAVVQAVWTLPDGSTVDQSQSSGTKSRARFTLKADAAGTYTLTVKQVSRDGYSFDADASNMLTGIVDVNP